MDHVVRKLTLVLLGACVAPLTQPLAQATAQTADERLARFESAIQPALVFSGEDAPASSLEQRMTQHGVPGLSVAVILDGELAWARGYGLADVNSGQAVTADTLFQAASISKPVSAMAALRLAQDGAVDLDQDVNELLTSWTVPEHRWSDSATVTLRRLLSHTAGTSVHGFPGYAADADWPTAPGVLSGEGNTDALVVDTEPGTNWRYSGGGYTVAQQLMVDVSGQSFPELLASKVLEPLGMDRSSFEQPLPEDRWSETATAHRGDGRPIHGGWNVYPEMAAAGLWTTPSELATFAIAIQQALAKGAHPVLEAEWIEAMLTPGLGGWGLGPKVGPTTFEHSGGNEGFRCVMEAAKDGSWGVVVMTNSDNGWPVIQEVLMTLSREYGWPGHDPQVVTLATLTTEQLQRCAGTYEVPGFGVVSFTVDGDRLAGLLPDGTPFSIRPLSDRRFLDPADGQPMSFHLEGEQGQALALLVDGQRAARVDG